VNGDTEKSAFENKGRRTMNLMKRVLMAAGATALAGVLALMVAPKAARGVAAALVQVVNTSANPVPNVDVNAPGEEPLQAVLCLDSGNGECAANVTQAPRSFVVPTTTNDGLSVKRAVIENLSGTCGGSAQLSGILISTNGQENVVTSSFVGALAPLTPQASGFTNFGLLTRLYADPGAEIRTQAYVNTVGDFGCFILVNGYLITK
jgi:hypothetical protein